MRKGIQFAPGRGEPIHIPSGEPPRDDGVMLALCGVGYLKAYPVNMEGRVHKRCNPCHEKDPWWAYVLGFSEIDPGIQ